MALSHSRTVDQNRRKLKVLTIPFYSKNLRYCWVYGTSLHFLHIIWMCKACCTIGAICFFVDTSLPNVYKYSLPINRQQSTAWGLAVSFFHRPRRKMTFWVNRQYAVSTLDHYFAKNMCDSPVGELPQETPRRGIIMSRNSNPHICMWQASACHLHDHNCWWRWHCTRLQTVHSSDAGSNRQLSDRLH